MKNSLLYILFAALLWAGCEQNDILQYAPENAQVAFRNAGRNFSFRMEGDATEVVIQIPFDVVGYPASVERKADFTVVADSTTATTSQYEILDAIVPVDSFWGVLRVKLTNDKGVDFDTARLYLRAVDGVDFIAGPTERSDYDMMITNTLLPPSKWTPTGWVSTTFLGRYSTAYYAFIIEATGETNFPVLSGDPNYNNGEAWSVGYSSFFLMTLKTALQERNQRVGSPLLHDDGPAAGYPVVVGKYTYP